MRHRAWLQISESPPGTGAPYCSESCAICIAIAGQGCKRVYEAAGLVQMYLLTGDPDTCTAVLLAVEHEEGSEETPGMDRDVRAFH